MFGWSVHDRARPDSEVPHADPDDFRMQTRDLYIAAGDIGFWQAAIRETGDPDYAALSKDIRDVQPFTIDLLYGDHEGGQRTITRFGHDPRAATATRRRWFPATWRATGTWIGPIRARRGPVRWARRDGSGGSGAETPQQGLTEAVVAGVLVLDEAEAEELEGDPAVDGGPDQLRRLGRRRLRR